MKRIFFLILFCLPAFLFAQIVKPGVVIDSSEYIIAKTKPTKYEANEYWLNQLPFTRTMLTDSLSLKYLTVDSSDIFSNYRSNFSGTNGNNIAFGITSLGYYPGSYSTLIQNNIAMGFNALNIYTNHASLLQDINIGYQSGQIVGAGTWSNEYNIGIGYNSDYSWQTGNNYNINIGANNGNQQNGNQYNVNIGWRNTGATGSGNYNTYLGYNIGTGLQSGSNNSVAIGYFSASNNLQGGFKLLNSIVLGNDPFSTYGDVKDKFIVSDIAYYNGRDFILGNFATGDFYLKANLDIDSTGEVLKYHSTIGSTNRTAGIDSLTAGIDTVRTTAYDASSLVFITNLSIGTGLVYINQANSLPGSYFVVTSTVLTDTNKFNWFFLKTY